MKKRWIAVLVCLGLLLQAAGIGRTAMAEAETGEADAETAEEAVLYTGAQLDYNHLVVGHTTALSGNFATQMWGYNTSDVDVYDLVSGYNLVMWDYDRGNFSPDPSVVQGLVIVRKDGTEDTDNTLAVGDEEGNQTYIFSLNEDLKYSDGTPITAADYAFAILLSTSPQARALGGDTDNFPAIFGVKEYKAGERKGISGIRILSDSTLSLTIRHDYLPFFYELGLMYCNPMPIHVIAPGCRVSDDGNGAYIDGEMTEELLRETLLNPETGYVSHPTVVSGPYRLLSFDRESGTAEFEINPEYLGNHNGIKPSIQYLTLMTAENETMVEKLREGEFGLLDKCIKADTVTLGIESARTHNIRMSSYGRIGQSYISFNCEKPIMNRQAVRQAIAWCLDKDETVRRYSAHYGIRVDGYYGAGQWMYQVVSGSLAAPVPEPEDENDAEANQAYGEQLAAWEALSLDAVPRYELNVEEAIRLLEEDGWTLNKRGEPFDPTRDSVRCRKDENGQIQALELTLVFPKGNEMSEIFHDTFIPYLMEAGIDVEMAPVEFRQLLRQYYRQEARNCDMMYLASNFNRVFDPWPTFDPADAEIGLTNYTGIKDEALYESAKTMSMTEPQDTLTYERRWIEFQKEYMRAMPAIPVYSNAYFDFYTAALKNFYVSQDVTWSEAIVEAYLSDPTAEDMLAEDITDELKEAMEEYEDEHPELKDAVDEWD